MSFTPENAAVRDVLGGLIPSYVVIGIILSQMFHVITPRTYRSSGVIYSSLYITWYMGHLNSF